MGRSAISTSIISKIPQRHGRRLAHSREISSWSWRCRVSIPFDMSITIITTHDADRIPSVIQGTGSVIQCFPIWFVCVTPRSGPSQAFQIRPGEPTLAHLQGEGESVPWGDSGRLFYISPCRIPKPCVYLQGIMHMGTI